MTLADEFRKAGIENIDDAVNHEADEEASRINNAGLQWQIEWLKQRGWTDDDIRNFYAKTEAET